jgi:hypothetical protein
MRIKFPKPLHGWRAFAGEVGVIVLGVLIALGAQQFVEMMNWTGIVDEANASMTKELSEDDGAQAKARIAMSPCIAQHLKQLEGALIAERDGGPAFKPPLISSPPFRTWDDNAWRAALSSEATSHMSTQRMNRWSAAYAFIPDMNSAAIEESGDWADLSRVEVLRAHPSELERESILTAIGRATHHNYVLTTVSRYLLIFSRRADVQVPDSAFRAELARQRQEMGTC